MSLIKTFNVKGERCSGTNYLVKLIETNLKIEYRQEPATGWKHGYYSFFRAYDPVDTFFTVVIFRNSLDWVRSLYQNPHHLEGSRGGGRWDDRFIPPTFSEFIRREVRQKDRGQELKIDRHPFYLTTPKNIFELRNWKNEHFLTLKNVLPNVCYIKYEDLIKNPEGIIREINQRWVNTDFVFENWHLYKETKRQYISNKYFDISEDDLQFMRYSIDWELEEKIGYERL